MKEITKAQEEILQALWKISEGAVSDVLDALPDPKPAYNTVATVIKVLEKRNMFHIKPMVKPTFISRLYQKRVCPICTKRYCQRFF
ncbi:MAG: BlaI/MecI/CopY family transcriptional regulator [Bacteroidales bacterium]|nr:BlaI/MecI/CopY family transcriptional regulator [Bacteroidales bacterium]